MAADNKAEGVYNIGAGQNTTLNQLVKIILNIMGRDVQPIYDKPRTGDPRHTLADISAARGFGYEPKWIIEDGLKKTIEEFK